MKTADNTVKMNRLRRVLLLFAMLVMVLALSGCRQRISNNSEVNNILPDEDGMKSERYQEIRDKLGLGEALLSIFPDWSIAPEDDEEGGSFEGEPEIIEPYEEPETEEEEEEEEEEPSGNGGGGPGVIVLPSDPTKNMVKVTLDPNGGKCELTETYVFKNKVYGELPVPYYSGYSFTGWFTALEGGDVVTPETKVSNTKEHTLYAQWVEADVYTVTFDPNGGTLSEEPTMLIKGGGKFGYLPTPTLEGKPFEGWFTEAEGGVQVKKGDTFTTNADLTLFAHWKEDPYTLWKNNFDSTSSSVGEVSCYIDESSDAKKSFISACKGKLVDADATPDYVVKFVSDLGSAESAAAEILESFPDATVVVIPSGALDSGDKTRLYYQYKVLYAIHSGELGGSPEEEVREAFELSSGEIRLYAKSE